MRRTPTLVALTVPPAHVSVCLYVTHDTNVAILTQDTPPLTANVQCRILAKGKASLMCKIAINTHQI